MTKSQRQKLYEYIQGDERPITIGLVAFDTTGRGYKANQYDTKLAEPIRSSKTLSMTILQVD